MRSVVLASLALSLFLVSNLSTARDVSIDLRLIQQNANVGDQISVNVNMDPVFDLKGIDILISFDNLVLEYESITQGGLIEDFTQDMVTDQETINSTGKIEYLAVLESPGPGIDLTSSGSTILTINFVAKSPGAAWIKLEPNDVSLGDSMANVIPVAIDTEQRAVQIGEVFKISVFNYPNPAPDTEGNTVIRCESLALLQELEARIYDISGALVKTIDPRDFDDSDAPVYEYVWDCKNGENQDVANGTYILWLKASFSDDEHETKTWKIAILH